MHLNLGDDGHWVRCNTTPPPPIPPTLGEGFTTHPFVRPPDMTVAWSDALLLKEMHNLHLHLTTKLTTQSKHVDTISLDMLAFRANIEIDFSSFHDQF